MINHKFFVFKTGAAHSDPLVGCKEENAREIQVMTVAALAVVLDTMVIYSNLINHTHIITYAAFIILTNAPACVRVRP